MQCASIVRQPHASTLARSANSAHTGKLGARPVILELDLAVVETLAVLQRRVRASVERSVAVESRIDISLKYKLVDERVTG